MPYFSLDAETDWFVYVVEAFVAVFCCPDPDHLVVADFAVGGVSDGDGVGCVVEGVERG